MAEEIERPSKWWIGYSCYTISYLDGDAWYTARLPEDAQGATEHGRLEISVLLDPVNNEPLVKETLLHEVMHTVFAFTQTFQMSYDKQEDHEEAEEFCIRTLSPLLWHSLMDSRNKKVLAYVFG